MVGPRRRNSGLGPEGGGTPWQEGAAAGSLGRKWRTNMGQAQGAKMKLDQAQEGDDDEIGGRKRKNFVLFK
jgi:hypothetical protein